MILATLLFGAALASADKDATAQEVQAAAPAKPPTIIIRDINPSSCAARVQLAEGPGGALNRGNVQADANGRPYRPSDYPGSKAYYAISVMSPDGCQVLVPMGVKWNTTVLPAPPPLGAPLIPVPPKTDEAP